jgi:geranylgeranyl diphosphate synthase type I
MRTEVMCGQYLDILEQVSGVWSAEAAVRVVDYKTVMYTTQRPLQIGVALAGGDPGLVAQLAGYARPIGEAFQFRDDILGVFGEPETTGKPAGDDLREGKRTLLLALAAQRATPAQASLLEDLVGDPGLDAAGVVALREVIQGTGALAALEVRIAELVEDALEALAILPLAEPAREALAQLAVAATERRV